MPLRRLLWLVLGSTPWPVAAAVDDGFCRNGTFPIQNLSLARGVIAGADRAYFYADMEGCPAAASKCRSKAYLVSGDRLVTGRTRGSFTCVYYPGKGGGTAGWISSTRIRSLPTEANPPPSAWIGRWSDNGNPILRISQAGRLLKVSGQAAWPSFNPPEDRFPGGPNVGEINEIARPSDNRVYARECLITLTLLGELLVAADPKMRCGGMNVSFTGVYQRGGR
jgi:hypothetical protein